MVSKLLLSIAFIVNTLLGSICMMQVAFAAPVPSTHGETDMLMSVQDTNACIAMTHSESVEVQVTMQGGPCHSEECLTMNVPDVSGLALQLLEVNVGTLSTLAIPQLLRATLASVFPLRIEEPPILIALHTVILRV